MEMERPEADGQEGDELRAGDAKALVRNLFIDRLCIQPHACI